MASASATSLCRFQPLQNQPTKTSGLVTRTSSSLQLVPNGWAKTGFSSLRTSRLQICCAGKPETVQKVVEIVRKQLALPPESEVTPDSKFASLGADSLDTVCPAAIIFYSN
ncbi:acyl carrier protein 1, chloroplastic-like [Prunus avium]|uniref:Acyl carrier protein 1, chloroplastic-like n=1 Tax=Prunus avium TaxID=42229 RepID=A0A6P5SCR7_PRUAV|nr:acyl carrier protein 1, chloroplastic-like [Prunus avium]